MLSFFSFASKSKFVFFIFMDRSITYPRSHKMSIAFIEVSLNESSRFVNCVGSLNRSAAPSTASHKVFLTWRQRDNHPYK